MARNEKAREQNTDPGMGRRTYMKMVGATAAATAATASTVSAAPSKEQYDNVVNVVDAGADPNGGTPIDSVVQQHAGNNTLLVFPDGRYKMGRQSFSGLTNFGMAAADGANPTLVPTDPVSQQGEIYVAFSGGSNLLMEGFDVDFRQSGYSGRIYFGTNGDFTLRNVTVHGQYDDGVFAFRFNVDNSSATGLVENVVARGGTVDDNDSCGMFVGRNHAGELVIRNCQLEGFSNNGLYGSAPGLSNGGKGTVKVEGGLFKNNNISQVRLGSKGSYARDVTIIVDEMPPWHTNGVVNARGLRIRDMYGITVENCDIIMDAGHGSGAIVFHNAGGRALVRNTRVQVNTSGYRGILAKRYEGSSPAGPVFENVSVTMAEGTDDAAQIVGRNGTEFRNCCIQHRGSSQNGIRLIDSSNCVIADSTINVGGQAIDLSGANADTSNVTESGTCPLPDPNPGSGSGGTGLPHTLSIEGSDRNNLAHYEFSVSDKVEKSYANGATIDTEDSISGSDVTGAVANGTDSYAFSGDVTAFSVDLDHATVYVDGSKVDPAELGGGGGDTTTEEPTETPTESPTESPTETPTESPTESPALDNTLTISGREHTYTGELKRYAFSVSGALEKSDARDATIDSEDSVSGSSAEGGVANGADSYRFAGEITDFSLDGEATVYLNGSTVDPAGLGGGDTTTEEPTETPTETPTEEPTETPTESPTEPLELPHLLTVEGGSAGNLVEYQFTADGPLEKSTEAGSTIDDEDSITDGTASGATAGGSDSYRFGGELTAFEMSDHGTVYLDGKAVDPAQLAPEPTLEHTLTISGREHTYTGELKRYAFSVSGALEKSDARDATIDSEDSVSGSSAEGGVANGADSYRFAGEITDFSLDGEATVYLDGQKVDPAQFAPEPTLPNSVVIDGSGNSGTSSYVFEVSDSLQKTSSLESGDTVSGVTAEGSVSGDVDEFQFAGNITRFRLDGSATVDFRTGE